MKCATSGGMSARRSRSGGRKIAHHVDAVVQVGAVLAALHHLLEVAVGGADQPHVDLHRLAAADAFELALLQHAQQLGLEGRRDVADLVEEQRAAVRHLEAALAVAHGAGEGALLVAEEFALQQRSRSARRS
jgi:hypothetical protein